MQLLKYQIVVQKSETLPTPAYRPEFDRNTAVSQAPYARPVIQHNIIFTTMCSGGAYTYRSTVVAVVVVVVVATAAAAAVVVCAKYDFTVVTVIR